MIFRLKVNFRLSKLLLFFAEKQIERERKQGEEKEERESGCVRACVSSENILACRLLGAATRLRASSPGAVSTHISTLSSPRKALNLTISGVC